MAEKQPDKQALVEALSESVKIARFNGTVIIRIGLNWYDMSSEMFARACYEQFGSGMKKNTILDLEHVFRSTAPDFSDRSHYILFGDSVWNMKNVGFDQDFDGNESIYGVLYRPREASERIKFIMDLANDDEGVYDDIMQAVAPLLLDRKPTGVIWFLGNGSNGKSSLVHLLYLIFGNYLTEVTVRQLEDERDAPQLNGKLGNVCKESSEAFIKDSRTYKSIGTHESFSVHKFHSQEMTSVNGNVHHIFSANNIPTFSDKSDGAKRRTLIIPFNNRFDPDESFEERTFTTEFIETFLGEMIKYAIRLKENGYRYKFSSISTNIKETYDADSNTPATYIDEILSEGVIGFSNFRHLYIDYENWCMDNGHKPSSINVFRRIVKDKGFSRKPKKLDGKVIQNYLYKEMSYEATENFSLDRPGLFKLNGNDSVF